MSTDPNWLYNTIAQSSSAIVAIIGGFITATVLSLSAEKRTLINQEQDKKARLELLRNEKTRLSQELDAEANRIFIAAITDKIVNSQGIPSFEQLIKDNPEVQTPNRETLRKDYEVFVAQLLQAKEFIVKNSDKINVKSGRFDNWVQTNLLDISKYNYEILRSVYNQVEKQKRESLSTAERLLWVKELEVPYTTPNTVQQEQERLREKIKADTNEIASLENDVKSLDFHISKFSYPPNLGWGIGVLGFLAVFGILLPVIIISREAFFPWAKYMTLIPFSLGLIGVFIYIVFQIRTLTKL